MTHSWMMPKPRITAERSSTCRGPDRSMTVGYARSQATRYCRALPAKGKNVWFRGCIRRPMGHPPGPTPRTAVRGAPPLREKLVRSSGRQKQRQGGFSPCHSQCIARWGACGKTRVVAQNRRPRLQPAELGARRACVVVDVWGRGDVEPVGTGGAVAGARGGGAGVRAARPADSSEGRQPEMRTSQQEVRPSSRRR
jgi:hypothetical protein